MANNIYISIYARKNNDELFFELRKGLANPKALDANALFAIKTILASRNLTEVERTTFEQLTEGEIFEKIQNVHPEERPSEASVVLEKPKGNFLETNWLRITFGAVTYMVAKYFYYHGEFPSSWTGTFWYMGGVISYGVIEHYVTRDKEE
jgi:hypothetical protein